MGPDEDAITPHEERFVCARCGAKWFAAPWRAGLALSACGNCGGGLTRLDGDAVADVASVGDEPDQIRLA